VHLAREFRRAFGASVGEYVRRLRIDYACRELAATGRSVTEIAFDAGFSSHSHFTAAFRRVTGTTPTRYRFDRR
jgi:AraC family transcriptional regulator